MPLTLWLVLLPLGAVPVLFLLRNTKLGGILAALIALFLARLAWILPPGVVWNILGRPIGLDALAQMVLLLVFVAAAVFFLLPLLCPPYGRSLLNGVGQERRVFYPAGMAILGLLAAAGLSRHLGITAIFIGAAAIFTVFVIQGQRLDSTRAALRFLLLMSLAMPLFLLAAWRIDQYQLSGGQLLPVHITQIVFFVWGGFAVVMAIVPFHGGLIAVASESAPATAAFVLVLFPLVALSTLLHLLAELPLLIPSPEFAGVVIAAGLITAVVGGGLAAVQRSFSQLMGYSALYYLGVILIAVGVGGQSAVGLVMVMLAIYVLAIILVASGVSAIRMYGPDDGFDQIRGLGRQIPVGTMALGMGGMMFAGMPLTPSFAANWQLFHSLAAANQTAPLILALAGLGVALGYLRGLRHALTPISEKDYLRFTEPPALLSLIGFLAMLVLALGIFPGLLIEPIQQMVSGVAFPIP